MHEGQSVLIDQSILHSFGLGPDVPINRELCLRMGLVVGASPPEPANVQEARSALHDLACSIIRLLLNADQVAIRRVVIAEGQRFPDLGRAWVENGQALGIADAEKIISVMIGSDTPSMQPRALAETFIALLDRAPQLVLVATLDPDQVDVEVEARHAVAVIESVIKATAESA